MGKTINQLTTAAGAIATTTEMEIQRSGITTTEKISLATLRDLIASNVVQALTFASTIAFNVVNGKWGRITLTGNVTAWTFSGLVAGDCGILRIKQDGTGGRTISWPGTAVIASGGIALSSGANELTEIGYVYDGVTLTLQKESYGVVAPDTDPPGVTSMRVENATPSRIDILYDEALLTSPLPANGDFSVTGKTITGIAIVGSTVQVTVSVAFGSGDTASIGYTPGTNKVKDAAGNDAPAITLSTGNVTNAVGGAYDADAQAYFDAQATAGYTMSTLEKDEWDAWVVGAKADGFYTEVVAVYPMNQASAFAGIKLNAKNPLDTDGGKRLTLVGSDPITYSSGTADKGTGTSATYFNTHIDGTEFGVDPGTPGTTVGMAMGIYFVNSGDVEIGVPDIGSYLDGIHWFSDDNNGVLNTTMLDSAGYPLAGTTPGASGFHLVARDNVHATGFVRLKVGAGSITSYTPQPNVSYDTPTGGLKILVSGRKTGFYIFLKEISDVLMTAVNTRTITYLTALSK